jgi:hypothetical protein
MSYVPDLWSPNRALQRTQIISSGANLGQERDGREVQAAVGGGRAPMSALQRFRTLAARSNLVRVPMDGRAAAPL